MLGVIRKIKKEGYGTFHSTETALIRVHNDIAVVFAAYDTVVTSKPFSLLELEVRHWNGFDHI